MFTLILWVGTVVVTLIVYLRKLYSRFSKYGVACETPLPILGNMGDVALQKSHLAEGYDRVYQAFPNERFVGWFEMLKPMTIVRDLELVKQVTIKDFEYFLDHRTLVDDTVDPMFGRNLFSMKGQEWKDMRSTLSPAFTSSKIKAMVPFMKEVNDQMIRVLQKKLQQSKTGYIDIDCKDLTTRYANDVIATCAFGVKVDSHTEADNEFYVHGRSTAQFGFRRILVLLGYSAFPALMKKLKLKLFEGAANGYFKHLFLDTMIDREERNIFRPDMIQLLMDAKKGKLSHDGSAQDAGFATAQESDIGKRNVNRVWSDIDLVAQAVLFFIAGFETVSSAMSFLLYELALNPEVQDRLVQEIKEHDAKNNGRLDYNAIQSMKYLDMVVSEVLRLWPPAVGLDRVCVKDYNMGKPNAEARKDFIIRANESLVIPVWSIHHDPAYFDNPDKFDPERFSDDNKANIKPFTYMPFGLGPRNCIGSRFALCEVKVMAYQLLQHFQVSPCAATAVPAKLCPKFFTIAMDGGVWVRLSPRK